MISEIVNGLAWPVIGAFLYQLCYRFRVPLLGWYPWPFVKDWAVIAAGTALGATVIRHFWLADAAAASCLIALAIWWWRSPRRRRASKMIGEKARKLREAMLRKMRELARPRQVWRPLPESA